VIGFDEACARVALLAKPLGAERINLDEAAGRVLAAPVIAPRACPAAATAAMDGYAVRAPDAVDGARLVIVEDVFAGATPRAAIQPGQCARIFTGAAMPSGADRVVIQEIVRREGDTAILTEAPGAARHVRAAGSDFAAGDVLIEAGVTVTSGAMVAAAAADQASVQVWRRPRLSILCTGDELAAPGMAGRTAGAVPESVSYGVTALAAGWGADIVSRRRVRDDPAALSAAAEAALAEAEVIVVCGGASVGARDHSRGVFEGLGMETIFAKVAIKPGKPVWMGRIRDRIVVGLPGNPSAAMVTARLFLAPLLAGMTGRPPALAWAWTALPLAEALQAGGDREAFLLGHRCSMGVEPAGRQDSAGQGALARADLLVRRRPGTPSLGPRALVDVLAF